MPRRTRRTATESRLDDQDIAFLAAEYDILKAEEASAASKAKTIKNQILQEMGKRKVEVVEWEGGRVTRTAAKTYTINIDELRQALPTRVFNRVTTRVVDKTLLSAAVQDRTISAELVASVTTQGENAPYIRISHGSGD